MRDKMSFIQSIQTCFSKYVGFSGRAGRSEFWFFALFLLLGSVIAGLLDSMIFGQNVVSMGGASFLYQTGILGTIFSLGTLLPALAVEVRRLHDIDKSGWWLLLCLIPIVGWIILLIWLIGLGTDGDNRFGSKP